MDDRSTLSPRERTLLARQGLVRLVRLGYLVVFCVVLFVYALEEIRGGNVGALGAAIPTPWYVLVSGGLLIAGGFLLLDIFTREKRLGLLISGFVGVLVGLVATFVLIKVLDLFVEAYALDQTVEAKRVLAAFRILILLSMCYLAVSVVLQTADDFRLAVPYVEFAKQIRGPKPLLVDTSALIDARLADLASVGAVQVPLIIPRFVVDELQLLGDQSDRLRRAKSKRGLETVERLQRIAGLDVSIDESAVPGRSVDQMLIETARSLSANICTTDTGLARVAGIQGIGVLNLNEVANALKPALLPGTRLALRLVKQGEHAGQGVGYLPDGTMIVVDGGSSRVGEEAAVEITSAMQTAAGRLLFATLAPDETSMGAGEAAGASGVSAEAPSAASGPSASGGPSASSASSASAGPGSGAAPSAGPTDSPSATSANSGTSPSNANSANSASSTNSANNTSAPRAPGGPLGPHVGGAGRHVPNRNPRR
jgi:uncharacterized protein YacL